VLGKYENIDRREKEPALESVDILLFTLDAETYLEKCLDSAYREIPVNKVLALDGGSKDKTVEILKKYPRVEIHIRPDIRTTGKGCEFLFSRVTTTWIVFMDADIELPAGWYDEMVKHKDKYDFFGCKRIMHYEFYRDVPRSIDINKRPLGAPWLARLECFKNYDVDDDYMWRATDMLLRQVAEKNGYKFGKVPTIFHYHHTTDNLMYESDAEKRGVRLVFQEPKEEILDKNNWKKRQDDFRRAVVKYIDPEFAHLEGYSGLIPSLMNLDMEWIEKTNKKWYEVLVDAKRKERKSVIRKLKRIAGHTISFLAAIKGDCREYIVQVIMSLR
jgi:glycosyltransferase involved in cell wall biosynthesis